MKRSKPLRSTARLSRKTPIKPRNDARRRKNFKRAYGSEWRVKRIKEMPCLVCAKTPSDNAHIKTGGMGYKSGKENIVPLCRIHHNELDDDLGSTEAFREKYGIYLEDAARIIAKQLDRESGYHR